MGRPNQACGPSLFIHDGASLFLPVGGLRNADLDGGGSSGKRHPEALENVHLLHFLSGLWRISGDDATRNTLAIMEKHFIVKNRLGLHARPAALFVQTTNRFKSSVKVHKGDQVVDGKSIMGLMMLAAEEGSDLRSVTEGPDAQDVLEILGKPFIDRVCVQDV